MISAILVAVGVVINAFALRDVFHTLLHPMGHGSLSGKIMNAVWRAMQRFARRKHSRTTSAGPLMFAVTILVWSGMFWIGFALIYMPLIRAAGEPRWIADALYRSACWITTMSVNIPFEKTSVLGRMLVSVECAFGLGTATASISWIMQMRADSSAPARVRSRDARGVRRDRRRGRCGADSG